MNPFRFQISSFLSAGGSFLPFDPMNLILEPSGNCGGLYLGNYEAASDVVLLKKHGIRAVLTVASDLRLNYPSNDNFTHEVISASDIPSFDLSRHFTHCWEFIDKMRAETNVLVHCLAGISRSATIVIGYLMRMNKMNFDSAFSFVKKRRRIIFPNPGFVRQLRVYSSQRKLKNFGNNASNTNDKNRSRSKALPENTENNLRSLSLKNINKKQVVEPINFKTPQKNYNYFNMNFAYNGNLNERLPNPVSKSINNNPILKKKPQPQTNAYNPYTQNLAKTNKKEMVKSYEKLNGKFMTPQPAKNIGKSSDIDNFMFLKSKKF